MWGCSLSTVRVEIGLSENSTGASASMHPVVCTSGFGHACVNVNLWPPGVRASWPVCTWACLFMFAFAGGREKIARLNTLVGHGRGRVHKPGVESSTGAG